MIVIKEEYVELSTKITNFSSYDDLKFFVKRNADKLSNMYNELSHYEELNLELEATPITSVIDKLWGFISNLSMDAAETLEACSDFYNLGRSVCKYISINK